MTLEDLYIPEPNSGCWLWIGGVGDRGYPIVDDRYAHSVIHELFNGPIPPGFDRHHKCEVKICINPSHIVVLTDIQHTTLHKANKLDCKRGHPFDANNTGTDHRGDRYCKTCKKQAQQLADARRVERLRFERRRP